MKRSLTVLGAPELPPGYRYHVEFKRGYAHVSIWSGVWPFRTRHAGAVGVVRDSKSVRSAEAAMVEAAEDAVVRWYVDTTRGGVLDGWWAG